MELREYWRIVLRYAWLVVLVVLMTLAFSLASRWLRPVPQLYSASVRLTVGVVPERSEGQYYTYDRYYTWLASEYLVDDLSEVVRSTAFAAAVSEELGEQGIVVPGGMIGGITMPTKQHRLLTLTMTGTDPTQLQAIAEAAARVLRERNREFLAQLGSENATVHVIDPPSVGPVPPSLKARLDLPLRLILALTAGIALAFLFDYLDDSVRDERDLRSLELPLLASLPKRSRR